MIKEKRNSKKGKITTLLLLIFLSISLFFQLNTLIDVKAESPYTDSYIVETYHSYSFCNDAHQFTVNVLINGTDNSWGDVDLILSLNNTNYTMVPIYKREGGPEMEDANPQDQENPTPASLPKSSAEQSTIYLYTYLYSVCNLAEGSYVANFYLKNSSGTFKYSNSIQFNQTKLNMTQYLIDNAKLKYNKIVSNYYLIYIKWENYLCANPEAVYIKIDSEVYKASWMKFKTYSNNEGYVYKYDFGDDDQLGHNISGIFTYNGKNYTIGQTTRIWTTNYSSSYSFSASLYPLYNGDLPNIEYNLFLNYRGAHNTAPTFKLEIDGHNSTLENKPYSNVPEREYNDTCWYYEKFDYRRENQFGPYYFTLPQGYNHTIKAYAVIDNNVFEWSLINNITYYKAPKDLSMNIQILDWNVSLNTFGSYQLNMRVNISCPYITTAYFKDQLYGIAETPWKSKLVNLYFHPEDWNDDDLSDGKLYFLSLGSLITDEDNGGNFKITFDFYYENYTTLDFSTRYIGFWRSQTLELNRTSQSLPEFKPLFNKGDWFEYKSYLISHSCQCCIEENEYDVEYNIYKIVDYGVSLGVYYVDVNRYIWNSCEKEWQFVNPTDPISPSYYDALSKYNITFPYRNVTERYYFNNTDSTILDGLIYLGNNISQYKEMEFQAYIQMFNPAYLKQDTSSINYDVKFGCLGMSFSVKILETKGVIQEHSSVGVSSCGDEGTYQKLINYGNGALPKDNADVTNKRIPGYNSAILMIAMAFGVMGLIALKYRLFKEE
ncbi:MAG: hypothetical protein ACTSU2_07880 [Promethearchaeota archaeon]